MLQVTLVSWGNMRVKHVEMEKDGTVGAISFDADLDNKVCALRVPLRVSISPQNFKKTLKVTWLIDDAAHPLLPLTQIDYDHVISKPVLAKDDDWTQFINRNSEVLVINSLA